MSWIKPQLPLRPQLLRPQPFSTYTTKKTISHPVPRTAAVAQPWTDPTANSGCQHRGPSTRAWVSTRRRSRGRYCHQKMGPPLIEACQKSACPSRIRYLLTKIRLMLYYFIAIKTTLNSTMRKRSHPRISLDRILQSLSINWQTKRALKRLRQGACPGRGLPILWGSFHNTRAALSGGRKS